MPDYEERLNNNPTDPLKVRNEKAGRELLDRFGKAANGFPQGAVALAAANLILTIIRSRCPTAKQAEREFDELVTSMKSSLLDQHYYPSGSRKNVFSFDQTIRPELVVDKDKMSRA